MKFLDKAKITVRSGSGGNGSASFRHAKYIEYGGPDGGDGGRGGDVIFRAVPNVNTLIDFRFKQQFAAENGASGTGAMKTGKSGADSIINVPTGTEILSENEEILYADLSHVGDEWMACRGGNGGWGNLHFKSSTNRAPTQHNDGLPGEERALVLRMKLIADAGLVGFPNAGKSSLLSALTAARPKIADYPFTTLHPALGVMYSRKKEFVLVDLPGLIEGAANGVGLGDKFLAHAERTKLILHVIDVSESDIACRYGAIRNEMDLYGGGLTKKPEIIVLNKIDMIPDDELSEKIKELKKIAKKIKIVPISAAGHLGLDILKTEIETAINNHSFK
ncbi:MAG: GTPase ObgE [Rickettsiales bacterium]|jgi:GTP-binding protein|nr:GTPase ObgE [Rickettsiales bacterium]